MCAAGKPRPAVFFIFRRGSAKPPWHGRSAHETRARCPCTPSKGCKTLRRVSMQIKPFAALRPAPEKPLCRRRALRCVDTAEARTPAAGNPDSFLACFAPRDRSPDSVDIHDDAVYAQVSSFRDLQRAARWCVRLTSGSCLPPDYGGHSQTGVVVCYHIDDYVLATSFANMRRPARIKRMTVRHCLS